MVTARAVSTLLRLRAEASFDGETFEGLELDREDLSGKELCQCTFRNCKLQESRWGRTRLEDCIFEGCDLTGMVPRELAARGVKFHGCKLLSVNWADLGSYPQMEFADCDLRYVAFVSVSLHQAPFLRCKATEATFIEADLTSADFADTDLTGAVFEKCILRKADFSKARGAFLDPAKNQVRDARINEESAALLASSFGLKVSGFTVKTADPSARPGRAVRRTR